MSNYDDRRNSPRCPIEDTLFIESVSSKQISMLDKSTANAINASNNGLQVELEFEVPNGSEIALWINAEDGSRSLVGGIVRWVGPTERDTYIIGIELDKASEPTIERWLESIH